MSSVAVRNSRTFGDANGFASELANFRFSLRKSLYRGGVCDKIQHSDCDMRWRGALRKVPIIGISWFRLGPTASTRRPPETTLGVFPCWWGSLRHMRPVFAMSVWYAVCLSLSGLAVPAMLLKYRVGQESEQPSGSQES